MDRLTLLKSMTFGTQVAEEETNELTTYFVETDELVELGFFEERGTREEPTFWVPFLYRDALDLIQGKADADEG